MTIEAMKVNKMYPISKVAHLLQVDDVIVTNGDESMPQVLFFQGRITKIDGNDIFIRRDDGEEGGADDGSWIVVKNAENGVLVGKMDISKAIYKTTSSLRLGDVFVYQSILYIYRHYNGENRRYVTPFLETPGGSNHPMSLSVTASVVQKVMTIPLSCGEPGCGAPATVSVPGYGVYCSTHADGFGPITTCMDCGSVIVQNESAHVTNRSGTVSHYLCGACDTRRREARRVIKNYSYKPMPKFISVEPAISEFEDSLFFGVEQEVECPFDDDLDDDMAEEQSESGVSTPEFFGKKIIDTFFEPEKWFYLKHDGSLSNGFEFVTHPATLGGHYKLPWEAVCRDYKTYHIKADNTTTCGLHIHASRDKIIPDHQVALGYFINFHRAKIEAIARRAANNYARFKDPNGNPMTLNTNTYGRYDALNWENNSTVEFRMYKGTVQHKILYASLEFTHAVILFTKEKSLSYLKQTAGAWPEFIEFVKRRNYPNLLPFLEERGIL